MIVISRNYAIRNPDRLVTATLCVHRHYTIALNNSLWLYNIDSAVEQYPSLSGSTKYVEIRFYVYSRTMNVNSTNMVDFINLHFYQYGRIRCDNVLFFMAF